MADELPEEPARAAEAAAVVERMVNSFMAKMDFGEVVILGWRRLVLLSLGELGPKLERRIVTDCTIPYLLSSS